MPWLVAAEVNRVLRIGGLVLMSAPQTWPLHDTPADYWRYTDEGLKILFGPEFGYEVIDSTVAEPIFLHHFRREYPFDEMPLHPAFGQLVVYSRKVAELPPPGGLELMQRALIGESGKLYPDLDHQQLVAGRNPEPASKEDEGAMPWTRS